ncbi:MAG: ribosome maturation factor RimP [Lachnospiraceae bacterium]|nr:ribosome maturation factor RimP [Lachnospiraceae bacterium]
MSKKETYEKRSEEIVNPILDDKGFKLWDVEYVKEGPDYYLRVYIDKEGGITIDDCVEVSRKLSEELDAEDFIEDAYILEVSSPGLGRTLKNNRDFENSIGKMVEVKTYSPVYDNKEFTGVLLSFDKESIGLKKDNDVILNINRNDIAKISLYVEF